MHVVHWTAVRSKRDGYLVDGQAIVLQVATLLIQGMPCLMDSSCQAFCEVIFLKAGSHPDISWVGTCRAEALRFLTCAIRKCTKWMYACPHLNCL